MIVGLCATLAVVFATRALGRLAGLSTAAACAASMAFFTMPPAFSFAIDNTFDRITLIAYSLTSMVVVHRAPRREPSAFPAPAGPRESEPHASSAALAQAIETAIARTGRSDIEVDLDPQMRFRAWSRQESSAIVTVLEKALIETAALRIGAYGGDTPGENRIWIVLRYKALPEAAHSLPIGRRPDLCAAVPTGDCPDCAVTSFDNGFERVLQISLFEA